MNLAVNAYIMKVWLIYSGIFTDKGSIFTLKNFSIFLRAISFK